MRNDLSFSTIVIKKILCIFTLLLISTSLNCRSKTAVRELVTDTNAKINKKTQTKSIKGAMYNLPLTVVKIAVPMKMKKETPGEFSDFAPCYFSPEEADGRVKTEKNEMSIDNPTFDSYGKADLSKTYVIQTTGRYFESRTVSATYNKEGVLTDGSVDSKDETLPFAIKTAEVIAGLGIKALTISSGNPVGLLGAPALNVPNFLQSELKSVSPSVPRQQETICYIRGFHYSMMKIQKKIDSLNADLDDAKSENDVDKQKEISKNIDDLQTDLKEWVKRYLTAKKTWERLQTTAAEDLPYIPFNIQYDKAEKAAADLKVLKKEREQFTQSNFQNINSEIYTAHLKELDDKIKALTESFLGKGETFNWTGNFEVEPKGVKDTSGEAKHNAKEKTDNKTAIPETATDDKPLKFSKVLFTYSKNHGVCYDDDYKTKFQTEGILIPKEFQFDKCKTIEKELATAQVFIDREDYDGDFIQKVTNAKSQDVTSGWHFRIPAKSKVDLVECKTASVDRCLDVSKEYGRQVIKIAQYGTVISLPAKTAGRNSSVTIALDETTGALKNFKASSSPAIDKSALDDASKTANNALDAADPLTKEKRRLDLLKTKNDINDEIKRAANSSTSNSQQ